VRSGVGGVVGLGVAALVAVAAGVVDGVAVVEGVAAPDGVGVAVGVATGGGVSHVREGVAADSSSGAGPSSRTRPLPLSATTNRYSASPVVVTPWGALSSVLSAHWPSWLKPPSGVPCTGQSFGLVSI
jgi:hypothetical protein